MGNCCSDTDTASQKTQSLDYGQQSSTAVNEARTDERDGDGVAVEDDREEEQAVFCASVSDPLYSPVSSSLIAPTEASFTFSNASFGDVTNDRVDGYLKSVAEIDLSASKGFEGPTTARTSTQALEEIEVLRRSEIYAAFAVTSKMIRMAARRIVPTVRRRRVQKGRRALITVHHRDMQLDASMPRHHDPMALESSTRLHNSIANPSPLIPVEEDTAATVEGMQLLELSGTTIDSSKKSKCVVLNSWDHLSAPNASEILSSGGTLFRFMCRTINRLSDVDRDIIRPIINLTSFPDETRENGVPHIDIDNAVDSGINLWTFIGVRTTYILPGIRLSDITSELLASADYHRNCQPGPPKVYDIVEPCTFRFTKTIIKFVFSLTMQLKVSEVKDTAALKKLEALDGIFPAKAMIMERTKKTKGSEVGTDSVAKCKVLLMYYPVTGGIMVTSVTEVMNRSIPRVAAPIANSFGGQGAAEAGETADKTRAYLLRILGDSRTTGGPAAL